jgi:hypothetical protein
MLSAHSSTFHPRVPRAFQGAKQDHATSVKHSPCGLLHSTSRQPGSVIGKTEAPGRDLRTLQKIIMPCCTPCSMQTPAVCVDIPLRAGYQHTVQNAATTHCMREWTQPMLAVAAYLSTAQHSAAGARHICRTTALLGTRRCNNTKCLATTDPPCPLRSTQSQPCRGSMK